MARIAVNHLYGLGMAGQYPKKLDELAGRHFDYVITVCDRAAETCPVFPGNTERIHWSFEDPAAVTGDEAARQWAFDNTAQEIAARLRAWLAQTGLAT
jgi:arsenate reductase